MDFVAFANLKVLFLSSSGVQVVLKLVKAFHGMDVMLEKATVLSKLPGLSISS